MNKRFCSDPPNILQNADAVMILSSKMHCYDNQKTNLFKQFGIGTKNYFEYTRLQNNSNVTLKYEFIYKHNTPVMK